ncbi:MAG TPA: hypothetical protein PLW65_29760, partial [Pseudomonadota bacterium]|nr:hypothetical protein [Pseudomonadota bacterium]
PSKAPGERKLPRTRGFVQHGGISMSWLVFSLLRVISLQLTHYRLLHQASGLLALVTQDLPCAPGQPDVAWA